MNRKEQLAQILAQLSGDMDALTASAAADNRSLTDEEQGKFDKASADFAKAEQEIANINRAEEAKARLALPAPRLTQPMDGATTMAAPSRPGTATITGGTPAARGYAHHGFDKGFGEFLMKVREVATHGRVDPRLMVNAVTTWALGSLAVYPPSTPRGSSHNRGATISATRPSLSSTFFMALASAASSRSDLESTSGTASSSWNCTPSKPSFL